VQRTNSSNFKTMLAKACDHTDGGSHALQMSLHRPNRSGCHAVVDRFDLNQDRVVHQQRCDRAVRQLAFAKRGLGDNVCLASQSPVFESNLNHATVDVVAVAKAVFGMHGENYFPNRD
jgi:hypothetical protein